MTELFQYSASGNCTNISWFLWVRSSVWSEFPNYSDLLMLWMSLDDMSSILLLRRRRQKDSSFGDFFSTIFIHFNPCHISSLSQKTFMDKYDISAKLRVEIHFVRGCPRGFVLRHVYLTSITFFRENHFGPLITCAQPINLYRLAWIYSTIYNMDTNELRLAFNTCVNIHKPLTNNITCVSQVLATAHYC